MRQFGIRLDDERDADVIARIESQPCFTDYIRDLVRRDAYDANLDYAMDKISELCAENDELRRLASSCRPCSESVDGREDERPGGCVEEKEGR